MALIYSVMLDLGKMHSLYKYSFKAFDKVFNKALSNLIQYADEEIHLSNIIESITLSLFNYIIMGLFEKDKVLFTYYLFFQV